MSDWKPIPFTGGKLEATSSGEIRNARTKNVLQTTRQKTGYFTFSYLHDGEGRTKTGYVHRAVLEAHTDVLGEQADHIDGDKGNNTLSNLRWCNNRENQRFYRSSITKEPMGISYCKIKKRWRAQMQINKVKHHVGYFKTKEQAAVAMAEAEKGVTYE